MLYKLFSGMNVTAFMSEYPLSPRSGTTQSQVHGKKVIVNKKEIALFYYKDVFYAVDEQCPHLGGWCMLCHYSECRHSVMHS